MSVPVNLNAVMRVLRRWQHGILNRFEAVESLVTAMEDQKNIRDAMRLIPPDLVKAIRESIEQKPRTEEEWANLKYFYIGGFLPSVPPIPEQLREMYSPKSPPPEELARIRAGTESLRQYFASLEEEPG